MYDRSGVLNIIPALEAQSRNLLTLLLLQFSTHYWDMCPGSLQTAWLAVCRPLLLTGRFSREVMSLNQQQTSRTPKISKIESNRKCWKYSLSNAHFFLNNFHTRVLEDTLSETCKAEPITDVLWRRSGRFCTGREMIFLIRKSWICGDERRHFWDTV